MNISDTATLGSSDVEVTVLGLGSAPLGGLFAAVTDSEADSTIEGAWECGIRFFDTAPCYGYGVAERAMGRVLSHKPRSELTLATKVGRLLLADGDPAREDMMVQYQGVHLYRGVPPVRPFFDFSADAVLRSLDSSLERLGLDRVDVVHIHDPDDWHDEALEGAFPVLDRLRSEGVIGAIGAGMGQWQMLARFAQEADFDCFLLAGRYTLLDQSALAELLPICEQRDISIIAGGVYNSGILCNPEPRRAGNAERTPNAIESWRQNVTFDYTPASKEWAERAQRLKDVCDRHDVPLMAAAIQFPLAHPAVACVLTGPRSVAELDENVRMFEYDIPDDLWSELRAEHLLPDHAPIPA